MTDEDIVKRLDTMISILQLAYSDEIANARKNVREDPVNLGILDATDSAFVGAGDLKKKVAHDTSQSEKTVQRRIQDLLTLGALEKRGAGPTVAYRATGLI